MTVGITNRRSAHLSLTNQCLAHLSFGLPVHLPLLLLFFLTPPPLSPLSPIMTLCTGSPLPPLACFYRNTLSLVRDIMRLEMVNVISVLEVQCDPVAHFSVSVYVVAPLSLHSHRKTLHYFILHCVHVLVRLRRSERV